MISTKPYSCADAASMQSFTKDRPTPSRLSRFAAISSAMIPPARFHVACPGRDGIEDHLLLDQQFPKPGAHSVASDASEPCVSSRFEGGIASGAGE
ncbi:MAG TPA: hypothetical protein VMM12_06695 [Longimicrobiales bacterium]|nr:hypothetical protein [Longimicrobiales bacterium]